MKGATFGERPKKPRLQLSNSHTTGQSQLPTITINSTQSAKLWPGASSRLAMIGERNPDRLLKSGSSQLKEKRRAALCSLEPQLCTSPTNRSQKLGHPKLKTKEIPMCLTKNIEVSEADGRVRLGT